MRVLTRDETPCAWQTTEFVNQLLRRSNRLLTPTIEPFKVVKANKRWGWWVACPFLAVPLIPSMQGAAAGTQVEGGDQQPTHQGCLQSRIVRLRVETLCMCVRNGFSRLNFFVAD